MDESLTCDDVSERLTDSGVLPRPRTSLSDDRPHRGLVLIADSALGPEKKRLIAQGMATGVHAKPDGSLACYAVRLGLDAREGLSLTHA